MNESKSDLDFQTSHLMECWKTTDKSSEYVYRDITSQELHNQLMAFMQRLADAIGARDLSLSVALFQ